MANVIRNDVVQVSFDVNLKELTKLQDELNELRKKLTGDMGGDAFDDLKKSANDSVNPLNKVKNATEKLKQKLNEVGKKAATTAYNGLKKVASVSFKALAAGIGAATTAMGVLLKKSVTAYADFEQLKGGVDTLFKDSAGTVQKYANDAYKTAGLSANEYMETVTSFSASLLQSLGGDTEEAAKYANMAISDMADNANKMGTDMGSIQYAYQGFAKQNYTMLDNLKLGYGGTKTEMERLVKDAAKLDKSIDANSLSYGNIVKAIHAVQVEMDIYGTTSKEAEHTITGSLNSMKSAWGNLLPALIQGGDSFDQCVENLVESILTFKDNIMPAMQKALSGIGTLIEKLAPTIEKNLPVLVDELLPPLIKAGVAIVQGLIKALPSIVSTLAKEIPHIIKSLVQTIVDTFSAQFPAISKIGDFFKENAEKITKIIPALLGLAVAFKAFNKIKAIGSKFSAITSLFGGGKGRSSKGGSGGILGNLINTFQGLAKTKTTTILKGMANLGIILGGLTVLAATIMALAPSLANLTDIESFAKLVGAIAVLGAVGTGLAKLAEIVGKIPVMTVVKGLANIAIIIAGMSALFLLIGAVSFLEFDLGKIVRITLIIGLLGTVGSVLSVFAGIVGMIPIAIVLTGLANITLVIGGLTALIAAFGALSKIDGFDEFISSGGDSLANLFKQIGKIAGSLIGSFGESLSDSLPKIGENLSKFVESIKPMFTAFQGVNMTGVGDFFNAIGSFMLQMAGNNFLSFFSGGTDLAGFGNELTKFATNASGFFNTVSTLPENGFSNAKLLFQSLADIGNVPKTGGLTQWFSGTTDFESLAKGLKQLSGEGVVNFYETVAALPQEGFDNAKALFQSLSDIGNVPNTGGIAQWFTGENDFAGLAEKLPPFGKAMAEFYNSISGIDDFSKISQLFDALKKIDEAFPKKGGLAQLFSGENNISDLGEDLKQFGEDTKQFFEQVNNLNVGKLNDLWESLKKPEEITTNTLETVGKNISDIVDKVKELPKKMGDAIRDAGDSLKDSLVYIWEEAAKAMSSPVNKIIEGANWILKEFGSDKKVASWTPYAKGTDGHKGGNALINDGRGAELVQMPNGKTFLPQGKNIFLPNAPKGMKVLSAEQTAQLMGKKSPTFRYADGTGDIDIWSFIDDAKGLVSKVSDKYVDYDGLSGFALHAGKGMVETIKKAMEPWAKKLFDEMGAMSIEGYEPSKGVEQWKATVIRALKMEGQYSAANVARTLYQMQTESGGNPRAINLWDSNAKAGIPSKGLMQVIDPTFASYARPGFNKNIWDPLSNILASIRYAISRYGSLANAYQGHGYANGGLVTKPGWIGEAGNEMVIPLSQSKKKRGLSLWERTGEMLGAYTPENSYSKNNGESYESNTYSPQFNLTVNGSATDRSTQRQIKQFMKEAMKEAFESMERKRPALVEV